MLFQTLMNAVAILVKTKERVTIKSVDSRAPVSKVTQAQYVTKVLWNSENSPNVKTPKQNMICAYILFEMFG